MKTDFLTEAELAEVGFRAVGRNARVSRHTLFFAPERISIGDHARIDAFCILSAGPDGIRIGHHVHIAAYVAVLGQAAVDIGDFVGLSVRTTIFSSNDDASGIALANSAVPDAYRDVASAPVVVGAHAMLGAGCIVLPGVRIGESAGVGAASLVKADVAAFAVVAGVPARVIGQRRPEHRAVAARLLQDEAETSK